MRGLRHFGLVVFIVGCGSKKAEEAGPPPPIRIALGDCASVTAPFISGPRPVPFVPNDTAETAQGEAGAAAHGPDDPRPASPQPGYVNGGAFASLTGTGEVTGFDDSNIYGGLLGKDAKAEVRVRGPGLIKPIETTKMKIVSRVLATSWAASTDFILASQRGGARWEALRTVEIPVAPVPIGTGASWMGSSAALTGSERPSGVLVVAKDAIFVGTPRVGDVRKLDGRGWDVVEAALKEMKASPFFVDRADLEIAGDDDVIYSDVVKAIDAATRVGFTEWKVVPPTALPFTRP